MDRRFIAIIGILLVFLMYTPWFGEAEDLIYQSEQVKPSWPEEWGDTIPAYMQETHTYSETDLLENAETLFSDQIKQKVEELDYDPVKIYQYVKNYINYIPYYGSKLGATGALVERNANSFDQASLLIAMFRYAGIPCRYVWGGIKMKPETVMNWLGVENIKAAEELLRKSGLRFIEDGPYNTTLKYSLITDDNKLLFHHVWVEAYLPYAGTRGTLTNNIKFDFEEEKVIHGGEHMWIPLDPSFKTYENKFPVRLPDGMPVDAMEFLNQYIFSEKEKMPDEMYIENLKKFLSEKHPEYSLEDLLFERRIIIEKLGILPTELPSPIEIYKVLGESYEILSEDHWKVIFRARTFSNQDILFANSNRELIWKKFCELYNKRITLSYDPINSDTNDQDYAAGYFNQLSALYDNTSRRGDEVLTPVFRIDGEKVNTTSFTSGDTKVKLFSTQYATALRRKLIYNDGNSPEFTKTSDNTVENWQYACDAKNSAQVTKESKILSIRLGQSPIELTDPETTTSIRRVTVGFQIYQTYGFKDNINNYAECSVSLGTNSESRRISVPRNYMPESIELRATNVTNMTPGNSLGTWQEPWGVYSRGGYFASAKKGRETGSSELKVDFGISSVMMDALSNMPKECYLHVFYNNIAHISGYNYGNSVLGVRFEDNDRYIFAGQNAHSLTSVEGVINLEDKIQDRVYFYLHDYPSTGLYWTIIDYAYQELRPLKPNQEVSSFTLDVTEQVNGDIHALTDLVVEVKYVGDDQYVEFSVLNVYMIVEYTQKIEVTKEKEKVAIETIFALPRYNGDVALTEEVKADTGQITTLHISQSNIPNLDLLEARYKALRAYETEYIDTGSAGSSDEPPVGELLNCLGNQYFYNISQSIQNIASVMNIHTTSPYGLAVASQKLRFDENATPKFFPGPYKLDIYYKHTDSSRINDDDTRRDFNFLSGMTSSAHEHKIFEDMFSIRSLSSMRILRMAHEADDNQVLFIDKNNYEDYQTLDDRDLIADHFENSLGLTDDDIFIIPQRILTSTEYGESNIDDGYILLENVHGDAVYIIGGEEQLNGGILVVNMDEANTNTTFADGMYKENVSNPDAKGIDVKILSNGMIVVFVEDLNSGNELSEDYEADIIEKVAMEIFASDESLTWKEKRDKVGAIVGDLDKIAPFTPLTVTNTDDSTRQLNHVDTENTNQVIVPQGQDIDSNSSDPIDMRTGEFYAESVDVEIPGLLPIIIKRTYSSQQESIGVLGYGWTTNLNYFLWGNTEALNLAESGFSTKEESIILRLTEEDGSVIEYTYYSSDTNTITFHPDPKANPELVTISDKGVGAAGGYFGNQIVFDSSNKTFEYTSYDGIKKKFSYTSYPTETGADIIRDNIYLERIEDLNGNYLEFEYYDDENQYGCGLPSKIKSKSGSYVQLYYDVKGRIERIVSSDRREIQYFYDNLWNLIKVIDASGKTTKYEYAKTAQGYQTHNLAKIIKPDNRILENIYDGEKVIEQKMSMNFNANPKTIARFEYTHDGAGHQITKEYTSIKEESNGEVKETLKEYKFKDYTQCVLDFNNKTLENLSLNGDDLDLSEDSANANVYTDYICEFPNENSKIEIGQLNNLVGQTKTIEFNFKCPDDVTSNKLYQQSGNTIAFTRSASNVTITATFANVSNPLTISKTNCPPDNWYHVCVTLDAQTQQVNLYFDGVLVASQSTSTNKTSLIEDTTSNIILKTGISNHAGYMDNIGLYSITKLPARKSPIHLISTTEKGFQTDTGWEFNSVIARTYDSKGNITSITDENDEFIIIDHWFGELTSGTYETQLDYDVVTIYNYDSQGRVIETIIDPDGSLVDDILDTEGNLNPSHADTSGRYRSYLESLSDDYYEVTSTYYHTSPNPVLKNKIIKLIEPMDNETIYTYDSDGTQYFTGALLTMERYVNTTCVYKEVYTYNADTNLLQTKRIMADPDGTTSDQDDSIYTYNYDRFGNVTSIENPEGEKTRYLYDQWGNQTQITNPAMETTRVAYNALNLPIKLTSPEGDIQEILYDKNGNKTGAIDPNGNLTSYLYDYSDSLVGAMDPLDNIAFTEHDIFGNKLTVINQNEYAREFEYDGKNRLIKEIDRVGSDVIETIYTYDDNGNVLSIEKVNVEEDQFDGNIIETINTYDYNGNLLSTEQRVYDGEEQLDENIIGIIYNYHENGTLFGIGYVYNYTTHSISITDYNYNHRNQVIHEEIIGTGIPKIQKRYEYDKQGNKIKKIFYKWLSGICQAGYLPYKLIEYKYSTEFDGTDRLKSIGEYSLIVLSEDMRDYTKDELLISKTFSYDKQGNLISEIDPMGYEKTYEYDKANRLIKVTQPINQDDQGNIIQEAITQYIYDKAGRVIEIIDPNNHSSFIEYDKNGQVVTEIDGEGRKTFYEYDANGNKIKEILPTGNTTTYVYDKLNRNTAIIDSGDNISLIEYDPLGNILLKADPENNVVKYEYDVLDRMTNVQDSLGYTINYSYTYAGGSLIKSMEAQMDDNGKIRRTQWRYNARNQLSQIIDGPPDNEKITTFSYNDLGKLQHKTQPNGMDLWYFYDKIGNLTTMNTWKDTPVPYGFGTHLNINYEYDKNGNRTKMTDESGTTEYTYYMNGLLKTKITLNNNASVSYAYDNAGNKTRTVFTGINAANPSSDTSISRETTYSYDKANNLKTVQFNGKTIEYTYNLAGQREKIFYPNNTNLEYIYGTLDRLTSLNLNEGTTNLVKEKYSYDVLGNILSVENNGVLARFHYDVKNQLTTELYQDANGNTNRKSYEYDGTGNRISLVHDIGDNSNPPQFISTNYAYNYNTLNQLETIQSDLTGQTSTDMDVWGIDMGSGSITIDGVSVNTIIEENIFFQADYAFSGGITIDIDSGTDTVTITPNELVDECYTYDENGNLGFKSVNGNKSYFYLWDAMNRLKAIYYHIEDETDVHRIEYIYNGDGQRVYELRDGDRIGYLYDGAQVIAEFEDSGRVTAQYIHGLGLGADVGSLLMKEVVIDDAVETSYYYTNHRGDVINTADDTGAIINSYRYDAFGNVIEQSGTAESDIQFSSKRFDDSINLSYFGVRYYDPLTGRFISRDPMEYVDGPNMYIYVKNNPLRFIDFNGFEAVEILIWGNEIEKGHIALRTSTGTYFSKHPKNLSKLLAGMYGIPTEAEFWTSRDDTIEYGKPTLIYTIPLTKKQEQQLSLDSTTSQTGTYTTKGDNCCDSSLDILRDNNIKVEYNTNDLNRANDVARRLDKSNNGFFTKESLYFSQKTVQSASGFTYETGTRNNNILADVNQNTFTSSNSRTNASKRKNQP